MTKDDTKAADPQDPAVETVRSGRARSAAEREREREHYVGQQAEALLEEFDQVLSEEKVQRLDREHPKTERYFIYCEGCGRPAVFLTRFPHDFKIGHDEWYAKYKPTREAPFYTPELKCQNCSRLLSIAVDPERGLGNFVLEESSMRLVDSFEARERRRGEAARQIDEIKTLKGVPTITVTPGQKVAEKARTN